MAIQVEILQKEIIKPSTPTPPDLKILRLSLLDQFTPIVYTSVILFYPTNGDKDRLSEIAHRLFLLKTSLSETLTWFYPLAGRIKDNSAVECEDKGVQFIQARVNCLLSDILNTPDSKVLKQFLPAPIESPEAATGHLLLVQASFFDCGGFAIGVCVTHKIADAATLTLFINCWAATARRSSASSEAVGPLFIGASIFPPMDLSIPVTSIEMMQQKCITKRFVFDGSKIAALRAKISSVKEPTRVEAVSALIWRCAMAASRSNLGVTRRPSALSISVNLRKRLVPPLPENYAGNCLGNIRAQAMEDEELNLLVGLLRKEIEEFRENYVKKLEGSEALSAICKFAKEFGEIAMSSDMDFYNCTSWCRMELYNADFGWGKPIWLSSAGTTYKNVIVLMDTRDGKGIEAWLTLSEQDMALFESNQDLLQFAAVNPSVLT